VECGALNAQLHSLAMQTALALLLLDNTNQTAFQTVSPSLSALPRKHLDKEMIAQLNKMTTQAVFKAEVLNKLRELKVLPEEHLLRPSKPPGKLRWPKSKV